MYKTNIRDIRFPIENASIILKKGLITKDDFARSDCNVTLHKTPYAIAKRIFVWTDIEVLTNEWTLVGNGNYKALEEAYAEPVMAQIPSVSDCIANVEEYMYAEPSVSEPAPEVIEEPSEKVEPEVQEEIVEDSIENEDTTSEETIDQPAEEVVEESEPVVEEQHTENVPVAVPVNPQQNTQNYTRINNKRNKHNRR